MPRALPCGYAVDFLRACYRSRWRFFQTDDWTEGEYFFAPAGTPFLGVPTLFGSKNYLRGCGLPLGQFGEDGDFPFKFVSGRSPSPPLLPLVCGDVVYLDRIADNPGPQPALDLDGIPRCCRNCTITDPVLASDFDPDSATVCAIAATCIEYARADHDTAPMQIALESLGWTVLSIQAVPAPDLSLLPGYFIAWCDRLTIVAIAGTSSLEQAQLQVIYGAAGPIPVGTFASSPLYQTAATWILGQLAAGPNVPGRPLLFAGYSYGGAVAAICAARVLIGEPHTDVQLYTFGSPKAMDATGAAIASESRSRRMVTDFDPFPSLPPTTGFEWIPGYPGLPWTRWAHTEPGIRLTADGQLLPGPVGESITDVAALAIAIILATTIPTFAAHEFASYACPLLAVGLVNSASCIWTDARIGAFQLAAAVVDCD